MQRQRLRHRTIVHRNAKDEGKKSGGDEHDGQRQGHGGNHTGNGYSQKERVPDLALDRGQKNVLRLNKNDYPRLRFELGHNC